MSAAPATSAEVQAIESRLGAKGRRVFSPAGWNESLRAAGIAAGHWWIANCGVRRWDRGYAFAIGYAPKSKRKRRRMDFGEPPFFSSGDFQNGFNTRAKVVATAKKGHVLFKVVVPGGLLNFHPKHVAAFRNVTSMERDGVAKAFRRALIQQVQTGRATHAAKKKAKASAKAASKKATVARRAEKRKERRAASTKKA